MPKTEVASIRATFGGIDAGDPPHLAFFKMPYHRLDGKGRYVSMSVPIRDAELLARAEQELQWGDEIKVTIETRWGEVGIPKTLIDFSTVLNEQPYSFVGALRAWFRENETRFTAHGIDVNVPGIIRGYGICVSFTTPHFEAAFYVWEKFSWNKAMSDFELADWRAADCDPDYQPEWTHYEYAKIGEMLGVLENLAERIIALTARYGEQNEPVSR